MHQILMVNGNGARQCCTTQHSISDFQQVIAAIVVICFYMRKTQLKFKKKHSLRYFFDLNSKAYQIGRLSNALSDTVLWNCVQNPAENWLLKWKTLYKLRSKFQEWNDVFSIDFRAKLALVILPNSSPWFTRMLVVGLHVWSCFFNVSITFFIIWSI